MNAVYVHESPVGPLTLVSDGAALAGVYFESQKHGAPPAGPLGTDKIIDATRKQLDSYFAGKRKSFDVPLAPKGTAFQTRVWHALTKIPYGETVSYGAIAAGIGSPKAVRAVGAANGRNPIPIIIPCHRVIGANGSLTGFGGGMARKELLLDLERGALFPAGR
ncbi:MAG: methylated-DNA--[protein]-cysteine S-methyltransferase [Alphaproteobacteria bacterium]|mgnify:CR=1 FL=1|nr:methylated-DNA--[protein]-cysteine S-methyltransferase [Alphaproteobacteria bacterium]